MNSPASRSHSAAALLESALVWESAVGWTPECLAEGPQMLKRFQASGFSFVSLTMGADWDKPEPSLRHFAQQRRWVCNAADGMKKPCKRRVSWADRRDQSSLEKTPRICSRLKNRLKSVMYRVTVAMM